MNKKFKLYALITLSVFLFVITIQFLALNSFSPLHNSNLAFAQDTDEMGCTIDEDYGMTDHRCTCNNLTSFTIMRCWNCGANCPVSSQGFCSDYCDLLFSD